VLDLAQHLAHLRQDGAALGVASACRGSARLWMSRTSSLLQRRSSSQAAASGQRGQHQRRHHPDANQVVAGTRVPPLDERQVVDQQHHAGWPSAATSE
jgi:hypothetical protein